MGQPSAADERSWTPVATSRPQAIHRSERGEHSQIRAGSILSQTCARIRMLFASSTWRPSYSSSDGAAAWTTPICDSKTEILAVLLRILFFIRALLAEASFCAFTLRWGRFAAGRGRAPPFLFPFCQLPSPILIIQPLLVDVQRDVYDRPSGQRRTTDVHHMDTHEVTLLNLLPRKPNVPQ